MSYYADGNGVIRFKQRIDITALNNFLDSNEFDYYFEERGYDSEKNALNVSVGCYNYHEPDKVLNLLAENFPVVDGSTIDYVGEDKTYWRFRYSEKQHIWLEDGGEVTYPADECRIINLFDCDTNFLVKTNVPAEIIGEALDYKNELLINDEPISSDFEAMQEYIWKKNPDYIFEEVGYVNEIESYLW